MEKYDLISERVFFRNPSMNIVMKGTILGAFSQRKMERTIQNIEKVHPIITSTIQLKSDGEYHYVLGSAKPLKISYFDKKEDQWFRYVLEQEKIPFPLKNGPLLRIAIFKNEENFDMILIIHHLLGDGLSLSYLFRDIINIYCDKIYNGEIRRGKIYNGKVYLGKEKELKVKKPNPIKKPEDLPKESNLNFVTKIVIHMLNKKWRKVNTTYTEEEYFEYFHKYHSEYETDLIVKSIENIQFEYLKEKCHENGVTINTTIISAFLKAFDEVENSNISEKENISVALNTRKYLNIDTDAIMGNYASGILSAYQYDRAKDFWTNTKILGENLTKKYSEIKESFFLLNVFFYLDGSLFDALFLETYKKNKNKLVQKVQNIIGFAGKERGVEISNIGFYDIDTDFSEYKLRDVVYIAPVSAQNITLGVVSIKNSLSIAILYKSNLIEKDMMQKVSNRAIEILSQ